MPIRPVPNADMSGTEQTSKAGTLGTRMIQIREQYGGNLDGLAAQQQRWVELRDEVVADGDGSGEDMYTATEVTHVQQMARKLVRQLVNYTVTMPETMMTPAAKDAVIAWVNSWSDSTASRTP